MTLRGHGTNVFATKVREKHEHVVKNIWFRRGEPAEAALMSCICSWEGTVSEWGKHSPRSKVAYAWKDEQFPVHMSMPNARVIGP